MNQLPEGLFIGPKSVDHVETGQPQPAQCALSLFIERKTIQERSLAVDAKIIRLKRTRLVQAFAAYRDTGNLMKGLAANAAIVREKTAESRFCERQNGAAEIG